jgi:copper homeostasis protein (lipoprotein)
MKTLFITAAFIFTAFCLNSCSNKSDVSRDQNIPVGDNSRTSLDWEGIYTGTLPCADCEGIQTIIKLDKDLTYEMKTKYQGKDEKVFISKNSFNWNEQGSKISLAAGGMYLVGENMLKKLDNEGNQITGNLADNYILKKEVPQLTERYWKLVELNGRPVKKVENEAGEIYMELNDKLVTGNGGCNRFKGTYEIKEGQRITFSKIVSTLIACENTETEREFFKVLEISDNYFLTTDTLVLNKARMASLARFEAVFF